MTSDFGKVWIELDQNAQIKYIGGITKAKWLKKRD